MEAVGSFETSIFRQLSAINACLNLNAHINTTVKNWHYTMRIFGGFQHSQSDNYVMRLRL